MENNGRLRRARQTGFVLIALVAAGACGAVGAGGEECPARGALKGVSLTVAPSDAEGVASAGIELCRDGRCEENGLGFTEATRAVNEECEDGACMAFTGSNGEMWGQVPVEDLSTEPLEVRVELRDADGGALSSDELTATPEMVYPNGPDCGAAGPQLTLDIEDGVLRKR